MAFSHESFKLKKSTYLWQEASRWKSEGTFFYPTFNVEKNKITLFFGLVASGLRYGHFLIFLIWLQVNAQCLERAKKRQKNIFLNSWDNYINFTYPRLWDFLRLFSVMLIWAVTKLFCIVLCVLVFHDLWCSAFKQRCPEKELGSINW